MEIYDMLPKHYRDYIMQLSIGIELIPILEIIKNGLEQDLDDAVIFQRVKRHCKFEEYKIRQRYHKAHVAANATKQPY